MSEQVRLNHSADDVYQMRKDWAESFHFDAPADLPGLLDDYDALHAEAEALRVTLLEIASVNPAQRGIEWAKSYASDGLKGAGSELYARWLDTFKEAEALRAEIKEMDALLNRQADLFRQTAIALRGPEPDLTRYSHADIPTRATALVAEMDALRAELAAIKGQQPVAFYWQDIGYPEPRVHGPYFGWPSESALRNVDGRAIPVPLYTLPPATPAPEVRCQTCDGTGDVHRSDGEWLGECHCVKAEQGERQEVVVPAKLTGATGFAKGIEDGWNAAIDAVMRLNATPQPGQDVRGLVEALENCAAALAWNCFGECRAIHAGPIMPAAKALDTARAALATHRQAQRQ